MQACLFVASLLLGPAVSRLAMLETEDAGLGAILFDLKAADPSASSTNRSMANASLAGIETVGADVAAHSKWVFYYKEWCPYAQLIFKSLHQKRLLDAFRKRATMRCFSSFEDAIAANTKRAATAEQVTAMIAQNNFTDPNEGLSGAAEIQCDLNVSMKEHKVWDEMERAWVSGHDVSCTKQFGNSKHTSPALVIGNTKYCESMELLKWFVTGVGSKELRQTRRLPSS
eukprot:TRINITY_DN4058_c0_g1_i1.p1 TRINITY_DN4058_c0_g1~~TRINITY_DN4058_c0_g1_i1.p1  ORF type:complete len:252 (-),score=29.56 TRINITY_DN4058_c0_g1_i1:254-937(-)